MKSYLVNCWARCPKCDARIDYQVDLVALRAAALADALREHDEREHGANTSAA